MRKCAGVALSLLCLGCDPGRTVHFVITPPGGAPANDSIRLVVTAVAAAAAARHGLQLEEDSPKQRCFARAHDGATLRLCDGLAGTGGFDVWVSEAITSNWSTAADSLRHEVGDTLQARFGPWVAKR
jgi:hypothetical protein